MSPDRNTGCTLLTPIRVDRSTTGCPMVLATRTRSSSVRSSVKRHADRRGEDDDRTYEVISSVCLRYSDSDRMIYEVTVDFTLIPSETEGPS